DASFNISTDLISFGFNELSGFRGEGSPTTDEVGDIGALLIGKPSMTYSGSLLALIEFAPRMRMEAPPPGSLLDCVTCTPGALPAINRSTYCLKPVLKSAASKDATEPVRSLFCWVP